MNTFALILSLMLGAPVAPPAVMDIQEAAFPGGEKALSSFVQFYTQYPEEAREREVEGTVMVAFVVEEDGKVTSPKVAQSLGHGCDEAALRTLKGMPRWQPATVQGVPVRSTKYVKVTFALER
jgi:protein TonB